MATPSTRWVVFCFFTHDISKEIRENLKWQEEGWGRIKAIASVNQLEWDTAIWFDKKKTPTYSQLNRKLEKKGSLN